MRNQTEQYLNIWYASQIKNEAIKSNIYIDPLRKGRNEIENLGQLVLYNQVGACTSFY